MQIFLPQMCCLLNVIFKKILNEKNLHLHSPQLGSVCTYELPSKIYLKHLFAINKYDKFWNISLDYFIKH